MESGRVGGTSLEALVVVCAWFAWSPKQWVVQGVNGRWEVCLEPQAWLGDSKGYGECQRAGKVALGVGIAWHLSAGMGSHLIRWVIQGLMC